MKSIQLIDGKKLWCRTCMVFLSLPAHSVWIARISLSGHCKGKSHLTNTEQLAHNKLKQQREQLATQKLYSNVNPAERPQMQWLSDDGGDFPMDSEGDILGFQGMQEILLWIKKGNSGTES